MAQQQQLLLLVEAQLFAHLLLIYQLGRQPDAATPVPLLSPSFLLPA
jgi:hypothetical protein